MGWPEFINSLRWVCLVFVTRIIMMFKFGYSSSISYDKSLAWWFGPNMSTIHFIGPTIHSPQTLSNLYSGSLFIRLIVSCKAIKVNFFISLFLCWVSRTPVLFYFAFFWLRSYRSSVKSSKYISFIMVFIYFYSNTMTSCK